MVSVRQWSHKEHIFVCTHRRVCLGIAIGGYLILWNCSISPLGTKAGAINAVNKLMKWIRKEEDRLFILTPQTY